MDLSTNTRPFSVLVVGGGVAGLACAYRFAHDRRWARLRKGAPCVTLIERKDHFGGRVKTVRVHHDYPKAPCSSCGGGGWYEAGASRIADTHRRVRQLARAVGCVEHPLPNSYDHHEQLRRMLCTFGTLYTQFCAKHPARTNQALQAISWYDLLTQECASLPDRDALVEQWGFRSVLVEMNAHDFWHYAMPQYVAKTYYTLEGGLQSLPDALLRQLQAMPNVDVRKGSRVLQVVSATAGRLRVLSQDDAVVALTPDSNHGQRSEEYDMVVLALPAEELALLQGEPRRHSHLWEAVSRNRLIRCYAKYSTHLRKSTSTTGTLRAARRASSPHRTSRRQKGRQPTPSGRNLGDLAQPTVRRSILRKCTTTHAPQWVQLSYCDHRHADTVVDTLRMPKGLRHLRKVVRHVLGRSWGTFRDADFDVHYWKHGTHSWKPQLAADDHYDRCLQPDAKVPLFVVGSSLSHYGHWMEGALETVDDAYRKSWRWGVEWLGFGKARKHRGLTRTHTKAEHATSHTTNAPLSETTTNAAQYLHHKCDHDSTTRTMAEVKSRGWVVLDGYVYDVSDIGHSHPGGSKLITNMRGKDLSAAYHRVGHSAGARAWIERYCKGRLVGR